MAKKSTKEASFSFEGAVKEVKEIISRVETNEVTIDGLADEVKRAKALLKESKEKLRAIEKSIND